MNKLLKKTKIECLKSKNMFEFEKNHEKQKPKEKMVHLNN